MCGFVAILQDSPIVDLRTARRALDTIVHRGPDAAGEWCEGDVFLGHRRLSIIDLATGRVAGSFGPAQLDLDRASQLRGA